MGLPSSYQRLCNGYQYPSGQMKVDSGFKDSLLSHSVSPAQNDTPPPIRLDKHPSFRKQRSTMSPSESFNGGAFGHSVGSLNEDILFNERATSQQYTCSAHYGSTDLINHILCSISHMTFLVCCLLLSTSSLYCPLLLKTCSLAIRLLFISGICFMEWWMSQIICDILCVSKSMHTCIIMY